MRDRSLILAAIGVVAVSISNIWFYWISYNNFFIGQILLILTLLLFLSISHPHNMTVPTILFPILFILSIYFLINNFDRKIIDVSTVESSEIQERHEVYAKELDKVYRNRFAIAYFNGLKTITSKIENNLASVLDFRDYFGGRKLVEYGKFPVIFAPLFIIGLLRLLYTLAKVPLIYFLIAVLIGSITDVGYSLGVILFFPFVSLGIMVGLLQVIENGKKLFHLS